jgi:ribokinase
VLVVAGLPNRHAAAILEGWSLTGVIRVFAPSVRNMIDQEPPVGTFAHAIDLVSCNEGEWQALHATDRTRLSKSAAIQIVTDGPHGGKVHFHAPGDREKTVLNYDAFPRDEPPRDTNHAGEAFTATFLTELLEAGWRPACSVQPAVVRAAAHRASVAAALVLDLECFGFPDRVAIDRALAAGRVRTTT